MGEYKYKLKEQPNFKVGDTDYGDGIKSTVSDVDSETGTITWDIKYTPNLEKLFDTLIELVKTAQGVKIKLKDDSKFEEIFWGCSLMKWFPASVILTKT